MRLWFGLTCLIACGLPFGACGSAESESGPAPLPITDGGCEREQRGRRRCGERVTKVGGLSDVLASGVDAPTAVAVDASGIYFASEDGGFIMSCPLTGCSGDPLILAQRQAQPHAIAVDDVAVYWITRRGGTVMRVAK